MIGPGPAPSAELLAPAGDFDTALAAFAAGADAVYCGLADFSARAFAKNLSSDDLRRLVAYAHANGKKVYVTFNTLVDEDDVEAAVGLLATLEQIGPDALIVQDLGIAALCRAHFPGLALHASTQLVAHNLEGVLALGELGFTRVVLARELSLEEIVSIAKRCGKIELECFIHGALCYSVSGLCLFGAMEKDRSGNRGQCPYCCRLPYADGNGAKTLAFSMKDMRLGEDARKLSDAGVASLKIEGRMKSALYVSSVTAYYRAILDGRRGPSVADLETVFSRRTTELYLHGRPVASNQAISNLKSNNSSPIDPTSLGHLGTPIGTVKRVTRDREGLSWLRFHTARALERHDGLQFAAPDGGKPLGFGISEMRQAISRVNVFEVAAGTDVEILLPEGEAAAPLLAAIRPGVAIYCSMSNAVKRLFPAPAYRESDWPGATAIDVEVTLAPDGVTATARLSSSQPLNLSTFQPLNLSSAKAPERTYAAVEKAFSKLGGTDYRLGKLAVVDPDRLFAPPSVLNDVRRDLVEKLDDARAAERRRKVDAALADESGAPGDDRELARASGVTALARSVKVRAGQPVPPGEWDEVVVAVNADTTPDILNSQPSTLDPQLSTLNPQPSTLNAQPPVRLALPVYTAEPDFNRLRVAVKRFLRAGHCKWEASDLATLRLLKGLGVTDITADWTLYAFNAAALKALTALGVKGFVASPENGRENAQYLSESGYPVAFLSQQSTPLFVSLTEPAGIQTDAGRGMADAMGTIASTGRLVDAAHKPIAVYRRDGLWVTTRPVPRTFDPPAGAPTRLDLSWDVAV